MRIPERSPSGGARLRYPHATIWLGGALNNSQAD